MLIPWTTFLKRMRKGIHLERSLLQKQPSLSTPLFEFFRKEMSQEMIAPELELPDSFHNHLWYLPSRGAMMIEITKEEAESQSPKWNSAHYPAWMPLRVIVQRGWMPWAFHIATLDPAVVPLLLLIRIDQNVTMPVMGILPLQSAHFFAMREPDYRRELVKRGPFRSLIPVRRETLIFVLFRHIALLSVSSDTDKPKYLVLCSGVVDAFLPRNLIRTLKYADRERLAIIEKEFLSRKTLIVFSAFLLGLDPLLDSVQPLLFDFYSSIVSCFKDDSDYWEQLIPYSHIRWNISGFFANWIEDQATQKRLEDKMKRLHLPNAVRPLSLHQLKSLGLGRSPVLPTSPPTP